MSDPIPVQELRELLIEELQEGTAHRWSRFTCPLCAAYYDSPGCSPCPANNGQLCGCEHFWRPIALELLGFYYYWQAPETAVAVLVYNMVAEEHGFKKIYSKDVK